MISRWSSSTTPHRSSSTPSDDFAAEPGTATENWPIGSEGSSSASRVESKGIPGPGGIARPRFEENGMSTQIPVSGVHHITLVGSNRQDTIDFYQGVLGMPLVME